MQQVIKRKENKLHEQTYFGVTREFLTRPQLSFVTFHMHITVLRSELFPIEIFVLRNMWVLNKHAHKY